MRFLSVNDSSVLGKFELHGPLDGLTLGTAERRADSWWCPVTPERTLVLGERPDGDVVDVTACYVDLHLTREMLARFCALDLRDSVTPVGGFRPGSVARTPGFVLRESDDSFLVLVGAAYADYMAEVVADA